MATLLVKDPSAPWETVSKAAPKAIPIKSRHLIALVPKMLTALREARNILAAFRYAPVNNIDPDNPPPYLIRSIADIDAIIAKAEGG